MLTTLPHHRHFTGDESFMDIEYLGNAAKNVDNEIDKVVKEDFTHDRIEGRDERGDNHPNRVKARI